MYIDHHELVSEFPEMADAIDVLKTANAYFATSFVQYHRLTGKVENLEEHDIPVSDFTMEEMKKMRVKLKDELYHFLLAYRMGQQHQ